MKLRTLPVKRRPVQKGLLKRLSAVTGNRRRQRVAAATAADIEEDDGSSKISRALTIIFLFHVLAITLWFVHEKYLEGRTPEVAAAPEVEPLPVSPALEARRDSAVLSNGDEPYAVSRGDNYARIAAKFGVAEADLRAANDNREIGAGAIIKIPPKRIVAAEPPEIAALRPEPLSEPVAAPASDDGLVDAIPVDSPAPRAIVVRPNVSHQATATAGGVRYEVKPGDSVWRIANNHGVSQDALMKANGISDPRKLRAGMTLVIPR